MRQKRVNKGIFDGSWYTILANIYNISRDQIEQRDKKRQQQRRRIIIGITSAVMITILSLAIIAWWQRDLAQEQRNVARERLYNANYNLAKVFEEKALNTLENARDKNNIGGFKNAFLFANAALQQEIKLEAQPLQWNSLGKLLDSGVIKSAFAKRWFSPAMGVSSSVRSVAFSPDGKYLASGSHDKTVRLWDVSLFILFLDGGKRTPLLNTFYEGAAFFWQVKLDGLEFKRDITPSLFPRDDYYFVYDKKFRPLLNPPAPDQTKFDQILEWAQGQLAERN